MAAADGATTAGVGTNRSMTLQEALSGRFSCRAFRPEPIARRVVEEILDDARRTPSWCNSQPWHVIVTGGDETERLRARLLAEVADRPGNYDLDPPSRYTGLFDERRRTSGLQLYASLGIAREDRQARLEQAWQNYRFFGAPHVAIVTTEADLGDYGHVDTGGFVSAFLLAAHVRGVATIAQAAVANYSDVVRDHFALPASRHVVCAISFGHADLDHPANAFRTDRAPQHEIADLRGFLGGDQ